MTGKPQLLVLPGIGEDERMSYPQADLPVDLLTPRYIEPLVRESAAHYCGRYSEHIAPCVDARRPLYIMGVSFGGMIAQELAPLLQAKGLILISTYRSSRELLGLLRLIGRRVAPRLPIAFYRGLERTVPFLLHSFTRLSAKDRALCAAMYLDFPKRWFREHCRMSATWPGVEVSIPTLRIHGTLDPIVPLGSSAEVDVWFKRDMHVCNLSHKEEVNRLIASFIERVEGSTASGKM